MAMDKFRILTYHRIGFPRNGQYEKLTVHAAKFAVQIKTLRLMRYDLTGLDDVCSWLRGSAKNISRPIVITFDDGYQDLFEYALPVLAKYRVPAVVFLVAKRNTAGWVGRADHGPLKLLSWPQIKVMSDAGIFFGSHSLTHFRLTGCTNLRLQAEVVDSKKIIEDHIGREVRHFCYPFGNHDQRVEDAVRDAGYDSACTTEKGAVRPGANPWRLPRLTVGKRMGLDRFLLRLMFRH